EKNLKKLLDSVDILHTSHPPGVLYAFKEHTRMHRLGDLHFAEEATSEEWSGYMEGAVRSGYRVAAEIVSERRQMVDNSGAYNRCELVTDQEALRYFKASKFMSRYASSQVVKALLAHPRVDPSAGNNEAFLNASKRDRLKTVKLLLSDPRVDPSVDDNKAIHTASHYEVELDRIIQNIANEMLLLLLAHPKVDPSARDNEAVRNASRAGYAKVVRLLLSDPRVDPTAQNSEAMRTAMREGHEKVVEVLLSDPRSNHMNIIHLIFFTATSTSEVVPNLHELLRNSFTEKKATTSSQSLQLPIDSHEISSRLTEESIITKAK
ncbi:hypothetical protein PROFUN_15623, partial [Planoprotostelium fungivorum]